MEPRLRGVLPGLILLLVGVLLLIGNLVTLEGSVFAIGLGVVFLITYFLTNRYVLLIAGCIVSAIGVFAAFAGEPMSPGLEVGWFLVALGVGFLAIYVLSRRWQTWWPLVPGGVLVLVGGTIALASVVTFPNLDQWQEVVRWWPVLLVLCGLWVLVARRLGSGIRLASGLALGLVTVAFVTLAVAVGVAANVDTAVIGGWWFATAGNLEFKDAVERSTTFPSGSSLTVRNSAGNISIHRGEGRELKLVATKHVWLWSKENAQRNLDRLVVDVQEHGNTVEISWHRSDAGIWFNPAPGESVDFEITVPADAMVDARSSSGKVLIRDIDGDAEVQASSGSVDLAGIGGGVDVVASSGDVRLESIGGAVDVRASSGQIIAKDLRGAFQLEAQSGNVEITGDIRQAGEVRASSGNVRLTPGLESAFRLDAQTRSGNISVDSRHQVERRDKNQQVVVVGTGGPTVRVDVSSGNITLN